MEGEGGGEGGGECLDGVNNRWGFTYTKFGTRSGMKGGMDGRTFSSTGSSHHFPPASSGPPLRVCRASVMLSFRRRSWPEMKGAERASPVQVLTSTMSRAWLMRVRAEVSWGRGMGEVRCRGWEELRGVGREGRRRWMSCWGSVSWLGGWGRCWKESRSRWGGRVRCVGRGCLNLLTPLMMRVPTLVTKPLTLSERRDERTRVEPGS